MSKIKPTKFNYCKDKEMVYDCLPAGKRHGGGDVIVFDINIYNVWGHDVVSRRIASEFPLVVKEITKLAITNKLYPGEAVIFTTQRGYTLAGLVNHMNPARKNMDDNETVLHMTQTAIEDMVQAIGEDRHFVSHILGRRYNAWCDIVNTIKKLDLNWSVYRD